MTVSRTVGGFGVYRVSDRRSQAQAVSAAETRRAGAISLASFGVMGVVILLMAYVPAL